MGAKAYVKYVRFTSYRGTAPENNAYLRNFAAL